MFKRILAIAFIFVCTSIAWFILGATIFSRSSLLDTRLKRQVASLWGDAQEQAAPGAFYFRPAPADAKPDDKTATAARPPVESAAIGLASSRVKARLDLEYRQKGLLWYSTYKVAFSGNYRFENTTGGARRVRISFPLPSAKAVYDDIVFLIDGQAAPYGNQGNSLVFERELAAGEAVSLEAGYRSQGLDSWRYLFGKEVAQVRDFELVATTNFRDVDFEANTLAPTEKKPTPDGWQLAWRYKNLLSGSQIAVAMPQKLQPGPLAGEISFFAPVSLLFFFFVIFLVVTLRNIDLHPMNYFFLAAAFFAFHLLLAYLVDHISIHAAFLICSAVSLFLVVSYLRLAVGIRFAAVEAGLAQVVYLVLFSYAFFFKGYTGLAVTIGAILTLFVAMQATGRIRWAEKFRV